LYEGEKPAEPTTNLAKIEEVKGEEKKEEEVKTNVEKPKEAAENKGQETVLIKPEEVKGQEEKKMKLNKSDENLDKKKNKKVKIFYNNLPFNCGSLHQDYKRTTDKAKSEEKTKK